MNKRINFYHFFVNEKKKIFIFFYFEKNYNVLYKYKSIITRFRGSVGGFWGGWGGVGGRGERSAMVNAEKYSTDLIRARIDFETNEKIFEAKRR